MKNISRYLMENLIIENLKTGKSVLLYFPRYGYILNHKWKLSRIISNVLDLNYFNRDAKARFSTQYPLLCYSQQFLRSRTNTIPTKLRTDRRQHETFTFKAPKNLTEFFSIQTNSTLKMQNRQHPYQASEPVKQKNRHAKAKNYTHTYRGELTVFAHHYRRIPLAA